MRRNVPPRRGEVWLFDCGMVAKVRPVLVLSVPFLKEGAFVAQSITTYPIARAIRKLGALNAVQLAEIETAVFKWLGQSV
jgi:mRNA interferase MazF